MAYAKYGLMEKFLKWSTASLWARMLHQKELPPCPDFVVSTGGENLVYLFDNQFWVQLCRSTEKLEGSKKGFSQTVKLMIMLTKDIYMTKNASLAVDSSFVKENLEKHKKIMCTPMASDPLGKKMEKLIFTSIQQCADDIWGRLPNQDEKKIVNYVHTDTICDIYKQQSSKHNKSIPLERKAPSRLPSLGASVNNGRHLGGAVGDLLKHHGEKYLLPEPEDGYLHSYCTYRTEYVDVRTPHDPEIYTEAENSSRKAAFARLSVEAQVVPLLEAFKVRTITKGDADQYHLARRWQKVIHGVMRKQFNCRLIGQPCNSAFLSQVFGNSPYFAQSDKEGFFVSGDYESATDLLHPYLSEVANEAICQRLRIPLEDQWVLKQCLTGHELKYEKKGSLHKQQWGQLMGSPSSFPILCLINLAATKVAYEVYFRQIGVLKENEYCVLEELPMCVNGDDILYWSFTDDHYNIWKGVTKQCGLKFSLGKNYTHKRVAIINSELYIYNPSPRPIRFGWKEGKLAELTASRLFRRMGALPPNLLFEKAAAVNSRLLIGGQRSTGQGLSTYKDITIMTDMDLQILAAELRRERVSPKTYAAPPKLTPGQQRTLQKPDELCQLKALQVIQRKDLLKRNDNLENYFKWRKTVEARGRKGREMVAGDKDPERARPAMMGAFTKVYNQIQISKLRDFRKIGLEKADISVPFFIPQSLGGLGLIPPLDHKFTIMEYMEVATLEGCPHAAEKYINKISPKMPMPDFMKAVNHELGYQKDLLAIKPTLKSYEDIGLLRFLGEDDGFWEHSFLTGFVTQNNMIVDPYEMGEAYTRTRNIVRGYKMEALMREKRSQIKQAKALGILKVVKNSEGKSEMVAMPGEDCFERIDFESVQIFRSHRASPKYE